MIVYFAVSDFMIKEQGMPEKLNGSFIWKLSDHTILGYVLENSPGRVLDHLPQKIKETVSQLVICKAKVADEDVIDAFRAALVGDVVRDVEASIIELTWVKNRNGSI